MSKVDDLVEEICGSATMVTVNYVTLERYNALVERLAEAERLILFYGGHVPPCMGRPCSCHFQEVWDAIKARTADSADEVPK